MQQKLVSAEQKLREMLGPGIKLKPLQREALEVLARGENLFASLPTGYGKSLLYWLPAAAWGWRVVVVSPLISLMEDQKNSLDQLGLHSVMIHSGMEEQARRRAELDLFSAKTQIVFLSPERISAWWESGYWQRMIQRGFDPHLIALDEMHCLEEWGEFRGAFRDFYEPIRRILYSQSLLLGLSASFSRKDSEAWMREFHENYVYIGVGLERENLSLLVVPIEAENERWLYLLSALRELRAPNAAIVYCSTQEECMEVARWLRSAGILAVAYHAGLAPSHRQAVSRAFRAGPQKRSGLVVCATSAFGMGIDYPHVDRVIHFSLPYDLSSYWQEAGRAGRSGAEAYAICFWRRSEITRLRLMSEKMQEKYSALWRAFLWGGCRKQAIANYLNFLQAPCEKCDRCRARSSLHLPQFLSGWDVLWKKSIWWGEPEAQPLIWLEEKEIECRKKP